jgi:2-polyprenyl-3-methyl-5-hydroxy-6-metoxy-1,4-benzoquinol methylase
MNQDMTNGQNLEEFYDKFWRSSSYGSRELSPEEQLRLDAILRFTKKYVLPAFKGKDNLTILDLGCGRGWLTSILANYGRVIGIDPLHASVSRAQELFPSLDFSVGTAKDILASGGQAKFQLIVSTEVIEHIPQAEKKDFMHSIYSLLVPGGFVILTTPRGELWNNWRRTHQEQQPIEHWLSERGLGQLSLSTGFKIIDKDRIFLPYAPYDLISCIACSRYIQFLMKRFPHIGIFTNLRYHCAIYQIILLQRG